jgi:hypothetical protein
MTTPQYDPRDVLDSYVATLNQTSKCIIRDAGELRYPKDIIKFVLRHCMKTITEVDKQSFLKSAYLSLGNFQELTDEERKAVELLGEIGPLHPSGTALQGASLTWRCRFKRLWTSLGRRLRSSLRS